MDMDDSDRRSASMRRRLKLKAKKDLAQDARLDELEKENEQLRHCISSLSHLLVEKGAIAEADLQSLADELDQDSGEES